MSLAAGIFVYSPWLLIALVACVVPAFLGETHFAFLGYSLSFQQTPARRELDYLRLLGGTKEGAKELKLFGLAPFLVGRYSDVATSCTIRRLAWRGIGYILARCWRSSAWLVTTEPTHS